MEKRNGVLYGVSVGPGDPELMTLKAVRCLEKCPVIAAPQTAGGRMLALDIARGAVGLDGKTILPLRFAMSRDPEVLRASHEEAARAVKEYLDAGQDVAMLNLGDVSVYATFGYLQEILEAEGYKTVSDPRGAKLLRRRGPAGPAPDGRDGSASDHRPGTTRGRGTGRTGDEGADEIGLSAAGDAGRTGRSRASGLQCDGLQLRPAGRGGLARPVCL